MNLYQSVHVNNLPDKHVSPPTDPFHSVRPFDPARLVDAVRPVTTARPVNAERSVDAIKPVNVARPFDATKPVEAQETVDAADHLPPSPTPKPQFDGVVEPGPVREQNPNVVKRLMANKKGVCSTCSCCIYLSSGLRSSYSTIA